jgi:SAM-dependent methyltransferase
MKVRSKQEESLDQYAERVYSIGLDPYVQALAKHKTDPVSNILDVGCGAGQWALAAACLYPGAQVTGVDADEYLLSLAGDYALRHDHPNCLFFKARLENLSALFDEQSFDLILCNSVIQYVNEMRALQIFSLLLRAKGVLLMFWNHGPGYYCSRLASDLIRLNFRRALYPLKVMVVTPFRPFLGMPSHDHFVTFGRLHRLAARQGLALAKIRSEPALDYRSRLWGVPKVFSCKGLRVQSISTDPGSRK